MNASQTPRTIVVVGAGIAGLTAAYRACEATRGTGTRVVVLEASERAGGVIETVRHPQNIPLELGPDSIVTDKPWGLELIRELGLEPCVVPTRREHAGSFICRGKRLLPVPEGFHLMAPSRFWPFATSGLMSLHGKIRMAADLFIAPRNDGEEESLAQFVRRRLGSEALERIAQPMVGGIYTADPERLSLKATMPRFLDMERNHGSLIRAMLAARRAQSASASARGPRYDLFVSLDDGLEVLPRTLVERLPEGTLRTRCAVRTVTPSTHGWRVATDGETFEADAVCLATPSYTSAAILADARPSLARRLGEIDHASSVTVNMAYDAAHVPSNLTGFGFVVPAIEKRTLLACTFTSLKYPGRSAPDTFVVRAFAGGALAPKTLELDDATLVARIQAELRELVGISGEPRDVVIKRWHRAMPQYHVGHLERIDAIEAELAGDPALALAGNAYRGTGIPDCIRSGNDAAERLLEALAALG